MESKFVDIHAHMSDKAFGHVASLFSDLEDGFIVLNAGENHADNERTFELSRKHTNILPCAGFHPNSMYDKPLSEVDREFELVAKDIDRAFAVSEIGLDYRGKDESSRFIQKKYFEDILRLAEKEGKVCIVHSRKAIDDVLSAITSFRVKVIIHNFEGNLSHLARATDMGVGISISTGFLKFKRDNVIKNANADSLFVETDSPVLSPDERANTPLNLPRIIEYMSLLRNTGFNLLKDKLYNNFERFFNG